MIGLGGGAVTLRVLERDARTFEETLQDPLTGTNLTASGFHIDLGLAVDARVTRREKDDGDDDESGEGGFAVGLKAGYTLSPGRWGWKVDDDFSAPGGPDVGIEGFYVRVMIGGWGRS